MRRSLFLNLNKLNASNCHLIKMDSISGFSRTLTKFYIIHYNLLGFSEHLLYRTPLDGCFYTFWKHVFFRTPQSGCCFLHFLNRVIFFLVKYLFKESPKKRRTFILTSMMKENSIIAFHHVFMVAFYAVTLQKLFLTDET